MDGRTRVDLATADGHDRHVPSGSRDLLAAGHEGVYEWAAEHLVEEGSTFLDFGCGTGYGSALVTRAGATFDGVDGSSAAIDYAEATFARSGVRFFVADLLAPLPPPIRAASYDVVFSSEVLEHVVDPFALVRSMAGFVRAGGSCFVGTPNRLWSKANMPGGGLLATSHVMEFTPDALLGLLGGVFEETTLWCRRLPPGAALTILPAAGSNPLVRGVRAFAHEVVPAGLGRLGRAFTPRRAGREWSTRDITWLRADDAGTDITDCVGLAAVCRGPRP